MDIMRLSCRLIGIHAKKREMERFFTQLNPPVPIPEGLYEDLSAIVLSKAAARYLSGHSVEQSSKHRD